MSCECYKIGGPFIAEDPNCLIHGKPAVDRRRRAYQLLDIAEQNADDAAALMRVIEEFYDIVVDMC